MSATPEQIKELAQAIANQAQAVADGLIPEEQLFGHVALLRHNADTLKEWVPDNRFPKCPGCGAYFDNARGLRSHRASRHAAMACKA